MKIYIGNLSKEVTDELLRDLVVPYGNPKSVEIVRTGESKGFGFIEFSNAEEATAAITGLDGKEIHGRPLKVNALPGTEDGDDR